MKKGNYNGILKIQPTFRNLISPYVAASVFWLGAWVLAQVDVNMKFTPFYFSLTVFVTCMTVLLPLVPSKFRMLPGLQLILGTVYFLGVANFIVILLAFGSLTLYFLFQEARVRTEKDGAKEEDVNKRDGEATMLILKSPDDSKKYLTFAYLIVGLSLFPAILLSFYFFLSPPFHMNSNGTFAGLVISLFGVIGWLYPRVVRFGFLSAIVYWISTNAFLIVIPGFVAIAPLALVANLTGMYLALLWLSPIRYHSRK